MDRLSEYPRIAKSVVSSYVSGNSAKDSIRDYAVFDDSGKHYMACHDGWRGHERVYGCHVHVDVIDGKIWVQHDGTNVPVVDKLLEAGVPKEDIVLGWISERRRLHTGFAVR